VKTLAKFLVAIVLVLVAVVIVIGPARVVAGTEYPFGIGPWSSNGRYCQDIYELGHLVDESNHPKQHSFTPSDLATVTKLTKTLTKSGPEVPRADFTAFFRTSGNFVKTMTNEGALINTWSNQNCTDPLMEAPSSLSHVWKGLVAHETFAHYPKNVIKVGNFLRFVPR
jgi:hypothetical protein